jgi:hypothetical protein
MGCIRGRMSAGESFMMGFPMAFAWSYVGNNSFSITLGASFCCCDLCLSSLRDCLTAPTGHLFFAPQTLHSSTVKFACGFFAPRDKFSVKRWQF